MKNNQQLQAIVAPGCPLLSEFHARCARVTQANKRPGLRPAFRELETKVQSLSR